MTVSLPLSKKFVVVTLIVVLLIGGAGLAVANHDPDIIHACIKNGGIEVVDTAGECKQGETEISLATEAALAALQSSNANLQSQLNNLETFVKRLHGNKAAVIDHPNQGTTSGHLVGKTVRLLFCPEGTDPSSCISSNPAALVLETGLLTEADFRSIITFDATHSQFNAVADLLTNGDNDIMRLEIEGQQSDGSFGGSTALTGPERAFFFGNTQVSTGPEFDDLEGIPISNISMSIDSIFFHYDSGTDSTDHGLNLRVFFGMD